MSETEVLRAVRSFPAGSARGPDGVRPQHILEMVDCRETGPKLHSALTGFVNCLMQGEIHSQVSPVLFGGNLIALEKKSGGVRPIAIGYTLRRIAAKCANSYAVSQLADYFSPIQLGVGVLGGCEAAVHSTRRYIDAMPEGHVVAKLDICNAFNSLCRPDAPLHFLNSPGHIPVLSFILWWTFLPEDGEQDNLISRRHTPRRPIGPTLVLCLHSPSLTSSAIRAGRRFYG